MLFAPRLVLSALLSCLCLALLSLPRPALAACGAQGKRPCPLWKGRKSCDAGLVEDLKKNRCVKPKPRRPIKIKPKKVIKKVLPKKKRSKNCGRKGQRPCTLAESFPSCARGLAEDFVARKCIEPKPLRLPSCKQAMGFVLRQAKGSGKLAKADTASFRTYLKNHPKAQRALQKAIATLKTKHRRELKLLAGLTKRLQKRTNTRASKDAATQVCSSAGNLKKTLKKYAASFYTSRLEKGALTLSIAGEADAIVGLAASEGIVLAYDVGGKNLQLGGQVSVQGQAVTDIDVAAGIQLGWWPGSQLTSNPNSRVLHPAESLGRPRDGLLSGSYVSAHVAVSPEMGVEAEFALDFVFEIPDLRKTPTVQDFLTNFSGITFTVTAGASAIPAQLNLGVAVGHTLTVALPAK